MRRWSVGLHLYVPHHGLGDPEGEERRAPDLLGQVDVGILGADDGRVRGAVADELDPVRGRLQRFAAPRPVRVEQGEPLGLRMALPECLVGAAIRGLPGIDRAAGGSCLLDVREVIRRAGPGDRAEGAQPAGGDGSTVAGCSQGGALLHAHTRFDTIHRLQGAGRPAEAGRGEAPWAVVLGVHRRIEVGQIDAGPTRDGIALAPAGVRSSPAVAHGGELEARGDALLVRASVVVGRSRAGIPEGVGHRVAQANLVARAVLHHEVGAPHGTACRGVSDEFLSGRTGERERMRVTVHDVVGPDDRPVVRTGAGGERALATRRSRILPAERNRQEVLAAHRRGDGR